jgi:hypothetical protein
VDLAPEVVMAAANVLDVSPLPSQCRRSQSAAQLAETIQSASKMFAARTAAEEAKED